MLLVLSVLATYVAHLGASWWLFTRVFSFESQVNITPLFAFLFLVALGVDYKIFLVTRAREEARRTAPRGGVLHALAVTGGVITRAGILLAAVFACSASCPWSCSPSSACRSASAYCSTPCSCAPCSCRRWQYGSGASSGGRGG